MSKQNKQLVRQALDELFQKRDLSAIDRYFAADYRQHNPMVANGSDGLRAFASNAVVPNPGFSARSTHVLGDGELVAVRSRYTGFGPRAFVGFDLFRVQGGVIAEHWDCLEEDPHDDDAHFHAAAPEVIDGDADAARALVDAFVNQALLGRTPDVSKDFVAAETPATASLRDACGASSSRRYVRLHRTVADGNTVMTQAEGTVDGRPHALYDLYLVQGGKIVAHWGVVQEITDMNVSGLGMF